MQAIDGGAKSILDANRSSLPQQPEVVTLKGTEWLLHVAAQRRGQSEGLKQGAAACQQAISHYRKHVFEKATTEDAQAILEHALTSVSNQLSAQARLLDEEQNVALGHFIVAKKAASEWWIHRVWRAVRAG